MDDLFSKMQQILSTEEGQAQLKNIAQMIGMQANAQQPAPTAAAPPPPPAGSDFTAQSVPPPGEPPAAMGGFDFANIAQMLSGMGVVPPVGGAAETPPPPPTGGFDPSGLGIDFNMILQLQQAMKAMNTDDANTQLLLALKPHFSPDRQSKVDQAIQMLRLYALWPIIKDSGLLGGLFSSGRK